jgi:tRNA threonylcarbamoyladenosine biosynthesis protein TsaE
MSSPVLQISYSLANIENAVHQFWQYAHQYRVFTFTGDLGAGKTTFITALCKYLGVNDTISSPTFALVNEYKIKGDNGIDTIYHMDWYRIKDAEDALYSGLEDHLTQTNAICFVEWPEKAAEILSSPYISVSIETVSNTDRTINAIVK